MTQCFFAAKSPPEQIKGLEYKTVVGFRLFDKEEFKQANELLKNIGEGSLTGPKHRAKKGHGEISYAPLLNNVFTSITRAQNHLIMVQDFNRLTHLSNLLRKTALEQETPVLTNLPSDEQIDWHKEAEKQRQHGNEEIARKIETEKLQETSKPVYQEKKKPRSGLKNKYNLKPLESNKASPNELKLPRNYSKKTVAILFKDPHIKEFFKPNGKSNSCGFINFIKCEDNQRMLAFVLEQHKELVKVVIDGLQSDFDERPLSMVLFEKGVLNSLLTNIPQLSQHLSHEFLTKAYSYAKEKSTPFLTLSKSEQGRPILEILFSREQGLAQNFLASDLTNSFNRPDNFPLFYLTYDFHFGGERVLQLLLKKNQRLLIEISASAFMKPVSSEFHDSSPFYWLSVYGISLLNQWIKANPQLITSLSFEELIKSLFANTWNSAFYWLTISPEAMRTFRLILDLKPGLIAHIPARLLAEQLTRQNSEGVSPLYSLSTGLSATVRD